MFGIELRQLWHRESATETVAEGRIVEVVAATDRNDHTFTFKLDSDASHTFQQSVTPLSPLHKAGEHVRVHYEVDRNATDHATVRWIESLDR
jgi:hypothetical protein